MSKRITIDPITRIEGHLRIDVDIDGGKVQKAWSSGQMWRGVELILLGRDPRDAWAITQRISASAPPCMPSPRCARSRTRSRWKFR